MSENQFSEMNSRFIGNTPFLVIIAHCFGLKLMTGIEPSNLLITNQLLCLIELHQRI